VYFKVNRVVLLFDPLFDLFDTWSYAGSIPWSYAHFAVKYGSITSFFPVFPQTPCGGITGNTEELSNRL
jgi:hypothetical protein